MSCKIDGLVLSGHFSRLLHVGMHLKQEKLQHIKYLRPLIEYQRLIPTTQVEITLDNIRGEIEFKDVHFRYPSRPDVQIFSGFSLHIPSGSTAALVGQSGSGKSTVINLLERFYDPDSGEVLIDGVDIKKLQLTWLRQNIGLVGQEPILFATTIRDNVAYGKDNATDEEIRRAIELANAAKFINRLPQVRLFIYL